MLGYATTLISIFGYIIHKRQKRAIEQLTKPTVQWFPSDFSEYDQMIKEAEKRKHGTATVST